MVCEFLHVQVRRQRVADARHDLLDAPNHVERRGRAALENRQQRAAHAILADDVLLRLIAVADLRHVAEVDRRALDGFDGQIVEFFENPRAGIDFDVVLGRPDFGSAAGQNKILRVDGVHDV